MHRRQTRSLNWGKCCRGTDLLRIRLGKFTAAFAKRNLDAINAAEVMDWLNQIGGALRTRNNYLNDVRTLIAHAKEQRWLAREFDEIDRVKLPKAGPGKPRPFSPEELEKLFAHAGLRAEEGGRLTEAHFTADFITADNDLTKTSIRRLVPILPALKPWLEKYPVKNGSLTPYADNNAMGAGLTEFIRAAGVEPRHNGRRDSYVSFPRPKSAMPAKSHKRPATIPPCSAAVTARSVCPMAASSCPNWPSSGLRWPQVATKRHYFSKILKNPRKNWLQR